MLTHSHALRSAACAALSSHIDFSKIEEMLGQLPLQSNIGGSTGISQSLYTWHCQTKSFFLNSYTHVGILLYTNIPWHRNGLFVPHVQDCLRNCSEKKSVCNKYRSKMTASTAGEQIELERNGERGKEKMKERGRGRWCLALFNYHQASIGFPHLSK